MATVNVGIELQAICTERSISENMLTTRGLLLAEARAIMAGDGRVPLHDPALLASLALLMRVSPKFLVELQNSHDKATGKPDALSPHLAKQLTDAATAIVRKIDGKAPKMVKTVPMPTAAQLAKKPKKIVIREQSRDPWRDRLNIRTIDDR